MIGIEESSLIEEGSRLAGFMPYLAERLNKMEDVLEKKIFQLLDKGELTPQLAVYAWQEKRILRNLYSGFNQKVEVSKGLAEQFKNDLSFGGQ